MNSDDFSYSGGGGRDDDTHPEDSGGDNSSGEHTEPHGPDSDSTIGFSHTDVPSSLSRSFVQRLGDFELGPELGHGGMGVVYLATEKGLGRKVALKVLPAMHRAGDMQVKRFLVEAKAAAQLSHDHIVPVYNIGEHEGIHYFTMRYIEGQDLDHLIRKARGFVKETVTARSSDTRASDKTPSTGTKPEIQRSVDTRIDLSGSSFANSMQHHGTRSAHRLAISVALIGQSVAEALHHAHEHGIVHRDVKPSNLMLDHNNKIWVTDFGLAQLQDSPKLTHTGDIVGTLRYMSPEQASGRRAFVDHRTDVYSLGATLYELATLSRAYPGDSAQEVLRAITFERPIPLRKINPRLPKDFETIISKAMERNPSERYATAAELAADLGRFVNNEALHAKRPGRVKKIRDWLYARPLLSALLFVTLVLLTLTSSITAWAYNQSLVATQKVADERSQRLIESEARYAMAASGLFTFRNPGLAMAYGLLAAKSHSGFALDQTLMAAADGNYELNTYRLAPMPPSRLVVDGSGNLAILIPAVPKLDETSSTTNVVDLESGKVANLIQSEMAITDAAFINNDRYIIHLSNSLGLSSSKDTWDTMRFGKVGIWDTVDRKLVKAFPDSQPLRISRGCFSTAKHMLVLPNRDNGAVVYDIHNWSTALTLSSAHTAPVTKAIFSPDESKIATLSMDQTCVVWDVSTGKVLGKFNYTANDPKQTNVEFGSDSDHLILWGETGTDICSLQDFSVKLHRAERTAVVNSVDDRLLVLDEALNRVTLINIKSATSNITYTGTGLIRDMAIVYSTDTVAILTEREIELFDAQSGRSAGQLRGHDDIIESMETRQVKGQLVTLGWDSTLRIWHTRSDLARRTFATRVAESSEPLVTQSQDGQRIALGSITGHVTSVINSTDANPIRTNLPGRAIIGMANQTLLCMETGKATLFDTGSQRRIVSANIPGADVVKAVPFESMKTVALLTLDGHLWLWNYQINTVTRCNEIGQSVTAIIPDGDQQALLLSTESGELISLDLATMGRKTIHQFSFSLGAIDLSDDGQSVLLVNEADTVLLWNRTSSSITGELKQDGLRINFAKFLKGDRILTHGGFRTTKVALWSSVDNSLITSHELQRIRNAASDASETTVAFATQNGAFVWDLAQDQLQQISEVACEDLAFDDDRILIVQPSRLQRDRVASDKAKPVAQSKLIVFDRGLQQVSHEVNLEMNAHNVIPLDEHRMAISAAYFGADISEINSPQRIQHVSGHSQPLLLNAFVDNGNLLTVSRDGLVQLYSLANETRTVFAQHEYQLADAIISEDRGVLVTADVRGTLRHWDVSTKSVVRESAHEAGVSELQLDRGGTVALAVIAPSTVEMWDLRSGAVRKYEYPFLIRTARLSASGKQVAVVPRYDSSNAQEQERNSVVGEHDDLIVQSLSTGQQQVARMVGDVREVCFADDDKKVVALSLGGALVIFDGQTMKQLRSIQPQPRVLRLLGAADWTKSTLYTASLGNIAGWDVVSGRKVLEIPANLSLDDASRRLPSILSTSVDGEWYLIFNHDRFFMRPTKPFEYISKVAPRTLTAEEQNEYVHTATPNLLPGALPATPAGSDQ